VTGASYRRARALVARWERGAFVLDNYLTGSSIALTPALLQFVDAHPGPATRDALVAAFAAVDPGGRVVAGLVEHGVYLAEGSDAAARDARLDDAWAWGQPARWFHFATRDTPFDPDIDRQKAWLTDLAAAEPPPPPAREDAGPHVDLPPPADLAAARLGPVLDGRRTTRRWAPGPLGLGDLATVLAWTWGTRRYVAESPIGPYQLKTSPSGGARHSIEVYPVALRVAGLAPGIYHYEPRRHRLGLVREAPAADLAREAVAWFAGQPWVADAPTVFLMTSVLARSMWKYRHPHAYRVVLLDAGHLGQTFHLVCTALDLGPFTSSGLRESAIEAALGIDGIAEIPVYAAATGRNENDGNDNEAG
jgi:SagB-type dehydrogenase family enzyme